MSWTSNSINYVLSRSVVFSSSLMKMEAIIHESVSLSVNQLVISHSFGHRSVSQSVSQSVMQSVSKPGDRQSVSQSVSQSGDHESVSQLALLSQFNTQLRPSFSHSADGRQPVSQLATSQSVVSQLGSQSVS